VQAVTYVVQRMAELAALFTLLSVFCYVRGRTAARRRTAWLAGSLAAFALGAVCKENAWITPALWWLAEFGLCRDGRPLLQGRADRALFALPFVLALLAVLDLASGAGPLARHFLPGYEIRAFSLAERLLTQPRVVLFHVSQLLWPAPGRFSVEHDFALSTALLRPPATALALAVLLAWCAAGLAALRSARLRRSGFWMLWLPVGLLPESSAVPLEMVFEHRMYLPGVGVAGLLAGALAQPRLPARATLGLAAAALPVLMWITPAQVRVWRDDLSLYANAVRLAPASGRAWTGYGEALLQAGRRAEAAAALERAIGLDPGQYGAWEKLGVMRLDAGDLSGAAGALGRARQLRGDAPSVLNHTGELYLRLDNPAAAREQFAAAVAKRPDEPVYRWNLALVLERLGDCPAGREQWLAYLRLERDPAARAEVEAHLAEGCVPTAR
jgi:tetratricopeptide (TPR) repeat protein